MNTEWMELQHAVQGSCITRESSGWYSILCPICGGGRDKRVTGGFLLTDDTIVYSCFRGKCDADTGLELGNYIPNKFKGLMDKLNIQIGMKLRTAKRRVKDKEDELDEDLYQKHYYPSIAIPEEWERATEENASHIISPLLDRCCNVEDVYLIRDGKYRGLAGLVHRWYNRVVGLSVISDYVFQVAGEANMMYTVGGKLDETLPVLLVEGEMDAMSMPNAVSVGGFRISPQQAYLLRGKNVVCIPEKSNKFIEQFEDYGYKMCIPRWDADDLNEAVVKYGIIAVAKMIKDGTIDSPFKARLEYQMWENKLK